jgi:cytochrome bd-type quinol oxidase subunit 2
MISIPYLLGWTTSIIVIIFISLYPFYLKKHKKDKYKGTWHLIGETQKSPQRALLLPLGFALGLMVAILINGDIKNKEQIAFVCFIVALIFILVSYRIYIFIVKK